MIAHVLLWRKHCGPAGEFPLGWASSWIYDQVLMTSEPHDGFVPVRSALLSNAVFVEFEAAER
jgi:hypothetical protein